jgi:hypothetical protein
MRSRSCWRPGSSSPPSEQRRSENVMDALTRAFAPQLVLLGGIFACCVLRLSWLTGERMLGWLLPRPRRRLHRQMDANQLKRRLRLHQRQPPGRRGRRRTSPLQYAQSFPRTQRKRL